MNKQRFVLASMLITVLAAPAAWAQKAGSFSASIGLTHLAPDVSSGDLSPPALAGTKVDVNRDTQVTGAVNYMVTDQIGLHVPLGFGFKHKISADGAIAGAGTLATTKALPITLIGQYRFLAPDARLRPYVGAGVTYARFYKERGTNVLTAITNPGGPATTVKFDSKFAPTLELGATFNLNERWYLDAAYTKTFLKTRGTLSTGQTIDVKLDPNAFTFQVGYKF